MKTQSTPKPNPIAIWFRSVIDYTLISEHLHLRASTSRKDRVYVRTPASWSTGVYLDPTALDIIKGAIRRAVDDRDALALSFEKQVIIVTLADGTDVELAVPAESKVTGVRLGVL